MTTVGIKGLID